MFFREGGLLRSMADYSLSLRATGPLVAVGLALIGASSGSGTEVETKAGKTPILQSLLDPEKLATLKPRSASDRIDKAMYWLHQSENPAAVMAAVVESYGWTGTAKGDLLSWSILRNLTILKDLGCLTHENLEQLRRGRAPTITIGPYAGEVVELDHIVPVAHAPHWSNVIANHQYLPRTLNRQKGDRMGPLEIAHEERLKAAGF
jgi:hypothetical protein